MIEPGRLESLLTERLSGQAARWLRDARTSVRDAPSSIDALFPRAGRCCGRGMLPEPLTGWTVDDAVRVLLLDALPLDGAALLGTFLRLYRHGDAAERRGVLRALPVTERSGCGGSAVVIAEDAIRTNDPRLVGAALNGGYAARHLGDSAFRHAVLKCVFLGIPLADVTGLSGRADEELGRMLADHVRERLAAGRTVPPDVRPVLEATGAPRHLWEEPA